MYIFSSLRAFTYENVKTDLFCIFKYYFIYLTNPLNNIRNIPVLIFHIPTNIIHLSILSLSSSLSIFSLSLSISLCYCPLATDLPLLFVSFYYPATKSINTKINNWSKSKINIKTPNQHNLWNTEWPPPLE